MDAAEAAAGCQPRLQVFADAGRDGAGQSGADPFPEPSTVRAIAVALHVTEIAVKKRLTRLYDKFRLAGNDDRRRFRLAGEAARRRTTVSGGLTTRMLVAPIGLFRCACLHSTAASRSHRLASPSPADEDGRRRVVAKLAELASGELWPPPRVSLPSARAELFR
ncbi:hypothetical protein [Micromonospora sp. B9E7]|uniref:hypothetical protein n=1 Tax=Micromonospora sp. B9E7 TaxID=3153574 RepID=UPI00325D8068